MSVKPHAWEVEEVDGGALGIGDFWICKACGASGGPVWFHRRLPHYAFLAGKGLNLDAHDCERAAQQVQMFKVQQETDRQRKAERQQRRIDRGQRRRADRGPRT
jgi:hypothetical protein